MMNPTFSFFIVIIASLFLFLFLVFRLLPPNLIAWRDPEEYNGLYLKLWSNLEDFFCRRGFTLWRPWHPQGTTLCPPDDKHPVPGGFLYTAPCREEDSLKSLGYFPQKNGLSFPARAQGRDVIIRVITAGGQGHEHLKILKRLATGAESLRSDNHVLPMLEEFGFQDIVFGIFPRVAVSLDRAICSWPKNSVEDVVYMFMEALEGVIFIHQRSIAHRDLFLDNFLLEWHPESLRSRTMKRPRVYLIDFETAISFEDSTRLSERLVTGLPFPKEMAYERPRPPELLSSQPHCPFLLDVWQLGTGFQDFKSTQREIDDVIEAMRHSEPHSRMALSDALNRVNEIVRSMPAFLLHVPPLE